MISRYLAKISATVGYGIFCMTVLTYINSLIKEPTDKVSSVSLSAFALIAALSGLCFGMAQVMPSQEEKDQAIYSGDKFLHSSLLILQVIALKYASGTIPNISFLKPSPEISKFIAGTAEVFLVIVSLYAAYFMLYGFESLNDFLWNRFLERQRVISKAKSRVEQSTATKSNKGELTDSLRKKNRLNKKGG